MAQLVIQTLRKRTVGGGGAAVCLCFSFCCPGTWSGHRSSWRRCRAEWQAAGPTLWPEGCGGAWRFPKSQEVLGNHREEGVWESWHGKLCVCAGLTPIWARLPAALNSTHEVSALLFRVDLLWSHACRSCPRETDLNKVGKEFQTQLMLRPLLTKGGTGGTNPTYLVAYTSPQIRTLLGVSVGPRVSQPGIHVPGVQSKLA